MINSCSATRQAVTDQNLKFSIQGGINLGGITENTDMTDVPGVSDPAESTVDAFSGATKPGYNIGVHANQKLKINQIETGLDYMYNYQTFNYLDAGNFYIGVRRLQVSQVMIPFTYNIVLFRNQLPGSDIQLKAGILSQMNFISVNETGILPEYSYEYLSSGIIIGFSAFLFQFSNENKLGIYFDAYLGSQIYVDFYNQPSYEMPSSSFMKFGLKYQFN